MRSSSGERSSPDMARVVYKVGDEVSTDIIYPERCMATVSPGETPQFAFADDGTFNCKLKAKEVLPGSILLAGKNFGCGSAREQAASCLRGHELVIVAKSFAQIFLQNAINLGLRVVVCPTIQAEEGDDLEITEIAVVNKITAKRFPILLLPKSQQAIIDAGGLLSSTCNRRPKSPEENLNTRLQRSFNKLSGRIII